jgi:pseudouridine synthase
VTRLGSTADPERDTIEVDGKYLGRSPAPRYYLLYKPRGVVTTTRDPHARRTVNQLVPGDERLFPVGRLDAASEGLLLLTNDGASAHALLHPSFEVPRTYRVSVAGVPSAATLRRLREGVVVEGRTTSPCQVTLERRSKEHGVLVMELLEGRRRQIRLMLAAVGHPVRRLVRTRFGPLTLRGLRPGEHRQLEPGEVRALRALARAARDTNRQR